MLVNPELVATYSGACTESLMAEVGNQDVVALMHARLGTVSTQPHALKEALDDAAREAAAYSLAFQAETGRLLHKLAALKTPTLLLKGSALAHWAFAKPYLRACSDVDVLLPSRAAAEQLAEALVGAGYARAGTSGELVAYELLCTRQITPDWALEVDVHWQLTNSPLFAKAFDFDELMADSIALPRLAPNARGLGPVHALLHAAMHRALNLSIGMDDTLKWLYDFVVLTRGFGDADWARTVTLAREKQLAGVTLNALEACADTFGLVLPAEVLAALREGAQNEALDARRLGDWRYMQRQAFRALPGLGAQSRWLWQRVFPSSDYMRYLYGDQGSYAGLLRERWRSLWRKWAK